MEFIVVALYLTAGFVTPAIPRSMVQTVGDDVAMQQPREQYGGFHRRDNSSATYPLTSTQPNNGGYTAGQQFDVTSTKQEHYKGEGAA